MDELYGDLLALLPLLRDAGHRSKARALVGALTNACNPREVLDSLRCSLAELPAGLPPDQLALVARLQDRLEMLWAETLQPRP